MNKIIKGIVIPALLVSGSAMAVGSTTDNSAYVSITGSVSDSSAAECTVTSSVHTVSIHSDISNMIEAGDNATNMSFVPIQVSGDIGCRQLIDQGRIGYKITGIADESDATVLKNADSTDTHAGGIGIGLFSLDQSPYELGKTVVVTSENMSKTGIGFQAVKLPGQTVTSGSLLGNVTVEIERL
ncbi:MULTISPECIES: fimbrial protein [Enterobacter cloacae complex]|uniref:fimbrial protein n=1 Tax=Enterobacter cloacae complex TaxID=354276 RepID=UPI00187619B2|nr:MULTISPECIES: fimbrial protein [Enterobacter cloacae complex]MBE4895986.1 fimbrial protein [Enterobacter cloacae complex sp. P16RS2]MCM6996027.1 fimbrial protein [Enterobacter asburiae]